MALVGTSQKAMVREVKYISQIKNDTKIQSQDFGKSFSYKKTDKDHSTRYFLSICISEERADLSEDLRDKL